MSVAPEDSNTHGISEYAEKQAHSDGTASPSTTTTTSGLGGANNDHLLQDALFPADSYTPEGVYWADLPKKEQWAFINQQTNQEAKREFSMIWDMFKANPLSPFRAYWNKYVLTGMGLFVEGYVLFSIGNLEKLFASAWPACWKNHTVCDEQWVNAVTYLEILGIIVGQMLVGYEGDFVGRKFGLVQDAAIMLFGSMLLTGLWGGSNLQAWVIMYGWSLFIYGIGVGGEYPMTGTKALESGVPGPVGTRDDRMHRGRNVVGAFLMQGWGQVFNQCVLLICIMAFHGGNPNPPFSPRSAQATFRVQFGLAVVVHAWLLYHRVFKVKDADKQLRLAKRKQNVSGYDTHSLKLLMSHYGGRLLATAGSWFAADVFFYGSKVFASTFIGVVHPGASLVVTWEYNLLNSAVSLVGYYLAFLFIDHKVYGRKMMTQVGFLFIFLCFLFSAIFYPELQKPGAPISAFQFLYFFAAFWTQFGPNCTTFLISAECYPASIRSTAHGFSAACGKLGALIPTVYFHYASPRDRFIFATPFGALGFILIAVFLPDTTGLDLREQERYWRCIRQGKPELYHGVAVHPRHLSWYERVVLKRNRYYDPEQDRIDRLEELRVLYEAHLIAREDPNVVEDHEHSFITEDVERYFAREAAPALRVRQQLDKEAALDPALEQPQRTHLPPQSNLEKTLGRPY